MQEQRAGLLTPEIFGGGDGLDLQRAASGVRGGGWVAPHKRLDKAALAQASEQDLRGLIERRAGPPGLINYESPGASLEKVQNQVRDLCTIVLYHFRESLLGDFGWVPAYQASLARPGA